ncbi:MAG TPA: PAS domain S-box protein, partial [Candidatus Binataceae bacterium]|nr:PAS domain S-box protein [Candidatus Binataceae bacterium]
RAQEIYGIPANELDTHGKWLTMMHPEDQERVALMVDAAKERRGVYEAEFRIRRGDGQERWIMTSGSVFHDAAGRPVRAAGVIQDVTDRRAAENALHEREALNRSIIDAAPNGMLIMNEAGAITLANLEAERMFGYAPGKLVGEPIETLLPDQAIDRALAQKSEARTSPAERELVGRRRDGTGMPIEISISPIETPHGRIIVASITDITQRKAVEHALQHAKDEAESATRAKSEFLASMSHEIRTPLNGIIGFADLLLDGGLSETQRRQLTLIRDSGASLLAIINDILDISKIEAGKLELESIAMSPLSIAGGAMSIIRAQAVAKGLELRDASASDLPAWIEGDPTRLRQILLNLLSNAVKFTSSGSITLHVSRIVESGNGRLKFTVCDTGPGIPLDRQHLLFQNFSQVDNSITRRFGGTGLGLAICKRLAEAMGGTIGVESEPGKGSAFHFTIALREVAGPELALADTPRAATQATARILVAEDIHMNQVIVESMLTIAGHSVTLVNNGGEAVEAIQSGDYDLVLMDMEMPEMDGLAATRAIRALAAPLSTIPIIALSANAMPQEIARCRAAGMNDHLSKPIDRTALLIAIARWLPVRAPEAAPTTSDLRVIVIDDAVLRDLESHIGKPCVGELSRDFRKEVRKSISIMSATTNRELLAREAHALISVAGNLGCSELMNYSRNMMQALPGKVADIDALVEGLKNAAGRALAAVDERYPGG